MTSTLLLRALLRLIRMRTLMMERGQCSCRERRMSRHRWCMGTWMGSRMHIGGHCLRASSRTVRILQPTSAAILSRVWLAMMTTATSMPSRKECQAVRLLKATSMRGISSPLLKLPKAPMKAQSLATPPHQIKRPMRNTLLKTSGGRLVIELVTTPSTLADGLMML